MKPVVSCKTEWRRETTKMGPLSTATQRVRLSIMEDARRLSEIQFSGLSGWAGVSWVALQQK